jgi:hypothetical protein
LSVLQYINKPDKWFRIDGFILSSGGLHYPTSGDKHTNNIKRYKVGHNYDFTSYYPNIYLNVCSFFDKKTTTFLKGIMEERVKAKNSGDTSKSDMLKLFINSIYGQLSKINKPRGLAVCLLGHAFMFQFIRDNHINKSNIIEINTDGILLKEPLDNIINTSGINIEYEVIDDIYHKDCNNKYYNKGGKLVSKGKLMRNMDINDKLTCIDISSEVYNTFIVKHKVKDRFDDYKYYKFKNTQDILNYTINNCVIMNKVTLHESLKKGVLVEIHEYNNEVITPMIDILVRRKLSSDENKHQDESIVLTNSEMNEIYQNNKETLFMLPTKDNKNTLYAGTTRDRLSTIPSEHNYYAFVGRYKTKNIMFI